MKKLITLAVGDIHPYEKNPRRNDSAVPYVKESIVQTGYVAPIIVDENNEILAGHTRYKALTELGKKEIECLRMTGMTEDQKKKYRLLDNKVAEFSAWDYELLDWELEDLNFEGFDFGFSDNVEFNEDNDHLREQKQVDTEAPEDKLVVCPNCGLEFRPL